MTILEENVKPWRSKLRLLKTKQPEKQLLKRKGSLLEAPDNKKQELDTMLNGYRNDQRGNGDTSNESPVATLSNMGNTCFLNSVLYTLRYAPTFLHNLHHLVGDLALITSRMNQIKVKTSSLGRNVGSISNASSRSTSSKDLLSLGNCNDVIPKTKVQLVTEKLHELYVTMHNLEIKDSNETYQPVALLQAIREANYIFEGNHQQDAHELLVYLLDNIRETCDFLTQQVQQHPELLNEVDIIPSSNSSKIWNVRRSWKKTQKKREKSVKEPINEEQVNGSNVVTDTEDTSSVESNGENGKKKLCYNFVAEDFEGITLRRTKCLECESVTERKEPFYDIPVPISVKEIEFESEVSGSAGEFYRKACVTSEKLCEGNKYLCEKCQRYNEASRDVLFEKLPNIMVLQLKRFTTSSIGVQKVNTYLPTPLELACFCETCNLEANETPAHRYNLCCVIMHLGASIASGHYIAYVKASDQIEDYTECSRNMPKGSLSASSSEKSLNFLKYFKPKAIGSSLTDNKSIMSKNVMNGMRVCKSIDCCGVKINKNVIENVMNSYPYKQNQEFQTSVDDTWLECDDEIVRPITTRELKEELSYKPNSTSTPYLLFYSKISDVALD